ncbi:tetratricopeptide repeat protein [bacterium]|nr:tetratricopeptide repeat protein [bacterium]MBP9809233.1 tetratricopeptide repeat protein [bacterium]
MTSTGIKIEKKYFRIAIATSLVLSLVFSTERPAQATKMNASPLPHRGQANPDNQNNWNRPSKRDFSQPADREALPPSQWEGRRPDYRDEEKRKKAEEAANALKAVEEQKKQAEAARRAEQAQVNASKQVLQNAIDANNRGYALGRAGRWNEAIAQHESACKLDPSNKQFRTNLSSARVCYGQQRLAQKDFSGAAHLFRKALTAAHDNSLAAKLLNEAIQRGGLDPTLAENRLGIGDQLAASGDLDGAMIEYQQAMQLDPGARTYVKMGDMSMRYGQAANALNWYRQAVVKDTNYGPAHRQLGLIYMMQKDYTSAAASLRKAVIIDAKDNAAGLALIDIWRKQVSMNPELAENHLGLAGAFQLTGDYQSAAGEYLQVEQLDPGNARLAPGRESLARAMRHTTAEKHRVAAEVFISQGLAKDALSEISQAVNVEPRNARYQFLMGEALESGGDIQGALRAYHTSVLIDPQNNQEAAARMRDLQNRSNNSGNNNPNINPNNNAPSHAETKRPKTLYEGSPAGTTAGTGPGTSSGTGTSTGTGTTPFTGSFRTHDDSQSSTMGGNLMQNTNSSVQRLENSAARQAEPRPEPKPQSRDSQTQATLKACDEMEMRRDFQGATNLLREALNNNLQNADIHHRLGLTLLNSGQLSESVSELRIASALSPANKVFSADLARALNIHKRSLTADPGLGSPSGGAGQ